jgi:pimeloyl-ACP methyl ester carboxylesterase
VVLYLHGATFPSALSVAYRFDGVSWRDALCSAGFDVWALDFLGFGGSDRYLEMAADADAHSPLGLAADVVAQVEAAVQFILDWGDHQQVSLVTHSWGSMPARLFAAKHSTLVDRIVMFAPLARREGPRYTPRPTLPAWKLVTNDQQWARFVEDVPPGEPPVLAHEDFTAWAEAYLDSDPAARSRSPPAVKTPTGPLVEIRADATLRSAAQPPFSVGDVSKLRVFVSVPQEYGIALKPGIKAELQLPGNPGNPIAAQFLTNAGAVERATRTIVTEFVVDNPQKEGLLPGDYVNAKLMLPGNPNILIIPSQALLFRAAGLQVAVIEGGTHVRLQNVTIGRNLGLDVQVVAGLKATDTIVANPSVALLDGQQVKVVQAAKGYEPGGDQSPTGQPPQAPRAPAGEPTQGSSKATPQ